MAPSKKNGARATSRAAHAIGIKRIGKAIESREDLSAEPKLKLRWPTPPTPDFVRVVALAPASSLDIRLVLPNGVRLDCPALLESGLLATLIEAASRL